MKRKVVRPEKVALCRLCKGTGTVSGKDKHGRSLLRVCPQCEGSGRVKVSGVMEFDIKPSYQKRVEEINRIYDQWAKRGVANREIWRRYVYPRYAISERTFYNILNASADTKNVIADDCRQLLLFKDEDFE